MKKNSQLCIEVWADWSHLANAALVGRLYATPSRGMEIFSFEYDVHWLRGQAQKLDPSLGLFRGQQYSSDEKGNFGIFLDSSPDRWGRMLMHRREAQLAREERRKERTLLESDYLLGVFDGHRMGALRFRTRSDGPFLDNNTEFASPPWTSLRELESASLELEKEGAEKNKNYAQWLRLLIAPGGSLGGARPKASVLDREGGLWIAKFPSNDDLYDVGVWEALIHKIATQCNIETSTTMTRKFKSKYHTFLTKRFDRTSHGKRIHFASAMTLLQRSDGEGAADGASYLELAQFLIQYGAYVDRDLEQLWRRIVFFICVSNTDDHLRNHGFLLRKTGWELAPAYDMNPVETLHGLKLNISETDNAQSLELAMEVTPYFRIKPKKAKIIIREMIAQVKKWRMIASEMGISLREQNRKAGAFSIAERE